MENFEQVVLSSGKCLVDEEYREHIGFYSYNPEDFRYCRIRVIEFAGQLYYHKMATGETLEFRRLDYGK